MKKLLLLGSLLATMAGQAQETAQTTYYWPGERVTKLQSGTQYFIYNTARSSDNYPYRSFFLYSDGSSLKSNNQIPTEFITTEKEHIFTLEQPASPSAENHWYIKSIHGNVGIAGQTNNTENRDIYITYWATANEDISQAKAGVSSLDEAGNPQNPNEIDTKTWLITKAATYSNVGDFAWNGNGNENNVLGKGGQWVKYQKSHPYAFYTVNSITIDEQIDAILQESKKRTGLYSDIAYMLQKNYGLIKDGNKFFSNYPELTPAENSSYAHLIDGNDNTYFHTSWQNADIQPNIPAHYLRAELPEAKKEFYIITKRRIANSDGTNNNNNRPTSILIEGCNEADGEYTKIATINNLPTASNEYYYFSEKISGSASYKYIRFTPQATNSGNKFFTYSEFYIIEANETTDKEMQQVRDLYNANVKTEDIENTAESMYEALLGVQLDLHKTEAQNLLNENTNNHAETPALGQYPTAAYNTFKEAVSAAQTSEEVASAIKTFKFSINAPVFTFDGAFNGDYNTTGKSIYYAANDKTYPWRWDKATNKYDATMLWKFVEGTSSSIEKDKAYTVTNLAGDLYFWNATTVIISDPTGENPEGKILIKLQGRTNPVHADRHGYTLLFDATTANSASAWKMTYVGESFKLSQVPEEQLAACAQLKTLVPECEPYNSLIGTGLGKYTCEGHDFKAALNAAKDIIAEDLYANPSLDAITALKDLQAAKEALVINQPEPGKFYRIKGASGKYISSETVEAKVEETTVYRLKMTEAEDETTVLFLSEGNRITTEKMQNMSRSGVHLQGLGGKYKFTAHQEIGKYIITPTEAPDGNIGGTSMNPLYDNSASNEAVDQVFNANDAKCAWTLEEINDETQQTKLVKNMPKNSEYATLAAPVSLQIPSGIKAYTAQVSGDEAILTELEGRIIPAGTAVVLKKTGSEGTGEYTFLFAPDAPEENQNNALVGLYTQTVVDSNIKAYILTSGTNGIGFYKLDDKNRTIDANKAYLEVPSVEAGVTMFRVRFDAPTTGFENNIITENHKEEYFDLQGRRVLTPTKGIYITKCGKKVVFNK